MNNYRVDVTDEDRVPVGTNSIRYVGDSLRQAQRVFREVKPGQDSWGKPNLSFFVALSRWDSVSGEYVIVARKYVEAVHYRETEEEKRRRLHSSGSFEASALWGNGSYHAKTTRAIGEVTCPMCNAKLRLDHGGQ